MDIEAIIKAVQTEDLDYLRDFLKKEDKSRKDKKTKTKRTANK